jgi:hypothetical protein
MLAKDVAALDLALPWLAARAGTGRLARNDTCVETGRGITCGKSEGPSRLPGACTARARISARNCRCNADFELLDRPVSCNPICFMPKLAVSSGASTLSTLVSASNKPAVECSRKPARCGTTVDLGSLRAITSLLAKVDVRKGLSRDAVASSKGARKAGRSKTEKSIERRLQEIMPGFWGNITASVDWCELIPIAWLKPLHDCWVHGCRCEDNYVVSYYVAEWWNTVSNIVGILLGLVGIIITLRRLRSNEISMPRHAFGYDLLRRIAVLLCKRAALCASPIPCLSRSTRAPATWSGSLNAFAIDDMF